MICLIWRLPTQAGAGEHVVAAVEGPPTLFISIIIIIVNITILLIIVILILLLIIIIINR